MTVVVALWSMRKTGVAVSIDGLMRSSSMSRSQSCLRSASVPSLMMRVMWSAKVASWSAVISSGAVSMRSWSSSRRSETDARVPSPRRSEPAEPADAGGPGRMWALQRLKG